MMYEDYGYEELSDMPEIMTMLEAGLMSQNMGRRSTRIRMKDWLWDEYDEIWGFGTVPERCPEYQLNVEGLRDRHERGIPTQLEEVEHMEFFSRMDRRRESKTQRGEEV
eukprot:1493888-Heterocapsa_arctica.AAC.1